MTHDFEIRTRLRAGALECHLPPDGQALAEGAVELTREERSSAAQGLRAGTRYTDVAIERRLRGLMSRAEVESAQPTRRSRKRPNSRPRNVARPR